MAATGVATACNPRSIDEYNRSGFGEFTTLGTNTSVRLSTRSPRENALIARGAVWGYLSPDATIARAALLGRVVGFPSNIPRSRPLLDPMNARMPVLWTNYISVFTPDILVPPLTTLTTRLQD